MPARYPSVVWVRLRWGISDSVGWRALLFGAVMGSCVRVSQGKREGESVGERRYGCEGGRGGGSEGEVEGGVLGLPKTGVEVVEGGDLEDGGGVEVVIGFACAVVVALWLDGGFLEGTMGADVDVGGCSSLLWEDDSIMRVRRGGRARGLSCRPCCGLGASVGRFEE